MDDQKISTLNSINAKLDNIGVPFQSNYSANELTLLIKATHYTINSEEYLLTLSKDLEKLLPVPKENTSFMSTLNRFEAILNKCITYFNDKS
ncbi:hypothetical protein [Marivirga arenosa]|uniref:Uncharacterized protein n=1 Tax=Marivirga arenosa TaxID=3059076 RepID=A0AA49GCM0_9BACT|nr:hypothetical protein [Marivirga sp. BKB1-2]WKK82107.1 hypothetical protein QYS47_08220 [Marivirga sp. BKB1-2]